MLSTLGGAVIGAAFLIWLSGWRPLDPTEIDWIMQFDWTPHYFGWKYFRTEPWHWPPGRIEGYYAPMGTAIGLTDSIPLAAYLLKPLSPWLPEHFQYLGVWWLLCFTLQGALGARLIGRWVASPSARILGATLFVLLPTMLARVAHAALMSHWLMLWALLIATRDDARKFRPLEWAALGLVAGLIQPYLAAMVLPLLTAVAIAGAPTAAARRLTALCAAITLTLLGWWLSGLFTLSEGGALSAFGLGFFTTNLLAPVSPGGWSRLLPELPNAGIGQQDEGFHYLGAGNLLLVVAAIAFWWWKRRDRPPGPPAHIWHPVLIGVCLLMTAFAISPKVTFGSAVIVDLTGPWSAPLALLRSSGRFVWPFTYVCLTWTIVTVTRHLPRTAGVGLMGLAVAVQAFDLHDVHLDRRAATHSDAFYAWTQPFVSAEWDVIARQYDHVVLAPPPQCGTSALPLPSVLRFASTRGLSVNAGVLARHEERARARYCEALRRDVAAGHLDSRSLYIVPPAAADEVRRGGDKAVVCGSVDAVTVCTTAAQYETWPRTASFVP